MSRTENKVKNKTEAFICKKCGKGVLEPEAGTMYRNHCPDCLWSMHVDLCTGDRMSVCRGMMEPVGVWVKDSNEWSLIHRCVKCGFIRANRIAGDDSQTMLMKIALKPAIKFPFPQDISDEEKQKSENYGGLK